MRDHLFWNAEEVVWRRWVTPEVRRDQGICSTVELQKEGNCAEVDFSPVRQGQNAKPKSKAKIAVSGRQAGTVTLFCTSAAASSSSSSQPWARIQPSSPWPLKALLFTSPGRVTKPAGHSPPHTHTQHHSLSKGVTLGTQDRWIREPHWRN